jgi:hypothetical protein
LYNYKAINISLYFAVFTENAGKSQGKVDSWKNGQIFMRRYLTLIQPDDQVI